MASLCSCTSVECEDYRGQLLSKAADMTDRPAAITDRRSAAAFIFWVASQLALELDAAAAEGDETDG
jgi:hypothetical protein